jgi:hypothetical protein
MGLTLGFAVNNELTWHINRGRRALSLGHTLTTTIYMSTNYMHYDIYDIYIRLHTINR